MVLYTLQYPVIKCVLSMSLNSAETLDSAKKHYSVPMLIRLKISLSLNSAVSRTSAAIDELVGQLW